MSMCRCLPRKTPNSVLFSSALPNSTVGWASCLGSSTGLASISGSMPSLCKISKRRATSCGSCPRSTLYNKQQHTTTSGTKVTWRSVVSSSSLKLCFKIPKAFSTTLRPLDSFLLNSLSSTDLCPAHPGPSL
jgi:hypothetical protein